MRGFPSPSRVAGQRPLPPQPGRTVPWRGRPDSVRVTHRRDEAAGFPPPCRGGPRGCSAGLPGLGVQPLRVAFCSFSRCRRPAGSAGRSAGRGCPASLGAAGGEVAPAGCQRQASAPGREPRGRSAAPSLPSPGRCGRGGRRRAEERRGNGAWSR